MNRFLLPAIFCLFLAGCSNTSPALLSISSTLVVEYTAEGRAFERLSVFAEAGSDIARAGSLRVVHKESGLSWTVRTDTPESLIVINGRSWFGSGYLYPPETELFSAGGYQVFYTDLAGREAVSEFFLDMKEGFTASSISLSIPASSVLPPLPPAVLTFSGDVWQITPFSGPLTRLYFLLYNHDGSLLYMEPVEKIPSSIAAIKTRYRDVAYIRVWMENGQGSMGVLLQPAVLP